MPKARLWSGQCSRNTYFSVSSARRELSIWKVDQHLHKRCCDSTLPSSNPRPRHPTTASHPTSSLLHRHSSSSLLVPPALSTPFASSFHQYKLFSMAPATPIYPLSALESQINVLPNGKPRKPPVRLGDCALKELVQYKCNIEISEKTKKPDVICEPVVRLLRQ
jgi:inner membrane protease subunit SOM1